MKKMNKLTMAALALAATGLVSMASAATVSAGADDLIIGFQSQSGQTGFGTDLEVDLGPLSNFTSTTSEFTLPQVVLNDLTTNFGSGWATTVNWSVGGIVSGSTPASPEFFLTSTTLPLTNSSLSGPYGRISSVASELNGQLTTGDSADASLIGQNGAAGASDAGITGSYTQAEEGTGYGFVVNAEQTGSGSDVLYDFMPENKGVGHSGQFPPATEVGTFSLGSNGVLTFEGEDAAIPEPSTYALMAGAMGLLFLAMRRRQSMVG
jgi:hypothetical protein